jgi:hypothetical protein
MQAKRRLDNKRIDYVKLQELILKAPHENLPLTLKENGFYFSIAKNYFNKDTPTRKEVKKSIMFGRRILEMFVLMSNRYSFHCQSKFRVCRLADPDAV